MEKDYEIHTFLEILLPLEGRHPLVFLSMQLTS